MIVGFACLPVPLVELKGNVSTLQGGTSRNKLRKRYSEENGQVGSEAF
jgi:hypothetical protein